MASTKLASKLRPLQDRVIVERLADEEVTSGGIVIPPTAKEKPMQGIVLAVGPGKLLDNGDTRAVSVKVGDKVLFGKYAGTEVKIDDVDLVVMREDDIIAVVQS